MAAVTTLAAPIGVDDTTLKITSATGVSAGMAARVDDEFIGEVLGVDGTTVKVRGRGWDGTAGRPHRVLAPIVFYTKSGTFPEALTLLQIPPGHVVPQPPEQEITDTVGADGTYTVPPNDATVYLMKATALALTLPAPSKLENGRRLKFVNGTAAAHVITATGLIHDGVTGGAKNTLTFGAFLGACVEVVAKDGFWHTQNLKVVTVA